MRSESRMGLRSGAPSGAEKLLLTQLPAPHTAFISRERQASPSQDPGWPWTPDPSTLGFATPSCFLHVCVPLSHIAKQGVP